MLATLVCLLLAAVLFVSLSRRAGFGSILGYLIAGALIGPSGFGLVSDVEHISEISEFGVLMLLFLIGLELRMQRIWLMRKTVFGLGGAQVVVTGAALSILTHLAGVPWAGAIVIGLGLALSSTAIVLPMLGERDLLASAAGRDVFSVLLFQDIASIPLIALVPMLASQGAQTGAPDPLGLVKAVGAIAAILLGGRFLVRPLFRVIGGAKTREVFTATALLVVAGAAALAQRAGLPMSLGAFAAGVVLSESEYRHELQADIEPFEGLLLGFFFISVGMSANTALALKEPILILLGVVVLLCVKGVIGYLLGRWKGLGRPAAARFALALPQGSEFAFVLFGAAVASRALDREVVDRATLIVAMSMFASPVLFALSERWLIPKLTAAKARPYDSLDDARDEPVVICGFGRFGQIVGRILKMRDIPFTALDSDAENVDIVRKFGHAAYYGDTTRLDLLRAVGIEKARLLVVAVADIGDSLKLVEAVRRAYPDLRILARARNRRHAHQLMDLGVELIVRETYYSSLKLSEMTLTELGIDPLEAKRTVRTFHEHDERMLFEQHAYYKDEKQLIQTGAQAAAELKQLFEADEAN